MKFDLVIKNGTIVRANEILEMDIGINGETIAEILPDLSGLEEIEAKNMLLLPGGIDPHVHLEMQAGKVTSSDDWETGTISAAIGGTTTVIDFIEPKPLQNLMEAFAERKAQADKKTVIDYSLHMTISDVQEETLDQIPIVIQNGVTSFKLYTTYDFRLSNKDMLTAMESIGQHHGLSMIHAENDAIIQFMQDKLLKQGKRAPQYHPASRPSASEAEAIGSVLSLGEILDFPIYIVHVSSKRGIDLIQEAWKREQTVFAETCPQYLLLTDKEYFRGGFEGAKFVCSPPLRKSEDNAALWQAVKHKTAMTIGTDHCPFFYNGQKDIAKEQFTSIPGGIPGIESRLSLIYSYGVKKGLFDEKRWVELCCTNPAKIFGLFPQKGDIQPGSDADIVIFDPNHEEKITLTNLHENVDYSTYENFDLHGKPQMTILRGKIIVKDGKYLQTAKSGKFISRKPDQNFGTVLS